MTKEKSIAVMLMISEVDLILLRKGDPGTVQEVIGKIRLALEAYVEGRRA